MPTSPSEGASKQATDERFEVRVPLTWPRLLAVTSFSVGLGFAYASEFALGTPLFRSLGGFIQPVAGSISDRCEPCLRNLPQAKWGRRRPFVLAGLVIALAGFFLFANPDQIAGWLGGGNTTAIVLAIVSLWVLNIGLNLMQGTAWTIVIDRLPRSQQMRGQALVSFLGAFAAVTANLCGMIDWVSFAPFIDSNNVAVFYIGAVVVLLTTLPTLLFADELSLEQIRNRKIHSEDEEDEPKVTCRDTLLGIWRMKPSIFLILFGFFITNAAFSPYLFYFTDWMGTAVYGGDAEASSGTTSADLYDEGVRMGSLGMGLNYIVTMLYSVMIPKLQGFIGLKISYSFVHVVAACCFLLPLIPAMQNVVPAEILAALAGLLNAAMNVTPYALLGETVDKVDSGLYIGMMTATQVMGQMVANFLSSAVASIFNTTAGMAVGGMFAAIGAVLVWTLILPEKAMEAEEKDLLVVNGDDFA